MALIYRSIVGFEIGQAVPPSGATLGYINSSGGYNTTDITAGSARSGSYGFSATYTSAGTNKSVAVPIITVNTTLPSDEWELRIRFFYKIVTLPGATNLVIMFVGTGTNAFNLQVHMNTTGQLRVQQAFLGATSPTAYQGTFSTDTWYQFRLRCYGFGQGGTVGGSKNSNYALDILSEDGTSTITSFSDSQPSGNNMPQVWPSQVNFGQSAAAGGGPNTTRSIYYDDYWGHAASSSDVASMEWPRGTSVEPFVPVANGATNNFSRGGVDTGANWSQVSDIPLLTGGSATNVNSATAGHYDLYQHAGLVDNQDLVYLVQAVAFLVDNTTPQRLVINGEESDVIANAGAGTACYALAWDVYTNAAPLAGEDFDLFEFGVKKQTAGGTTMTVQQCFLEVLTGPPLIYELDLPAAGDPNAFAVSALFGEGAATVEGNYLYEHDISLATGTLVYRLGHQGEEITVPTTWRINRIDVGYRDEETA